MSCNYTNCVATSVAMQRFVATLVTQIAQAVSKLLDWLNILTKRYDNATNVMGVYTTSRLPTKGVFVTDTLSRHLMLRVPFNWYGICKRLDSER